MKHNKITHKFYLLGSLYVFLWSITYANQNQTVDNLPQFWWIALRIPSGLR